MKKLVRFLVFICLLHTPTVFGVTTYPDSLRLLLQTSDNPDIIARTHLKIAELTIYNDPAEARAHADTANFIARTFNLPSQLGHAYSLYGLTSIINGNFEESKLFLDTAYTIFKSINDTAGSAVAAGNLAAVYQNEADYTSALHYNFLALDNYKLCNHEIGIMRTQSNIGAIYHALQDYENALHYYKIVQNFCEENNSDLMTLCNVLGNSASIYLILGKPDTAMSLSQKMLTISLEQKMDTWTAEAYASIARVYENTKDYSSCVLYFDKAIQLYEDSAEPYRALLIKTEKATSLCEFGHYSESMSIANEILATARENGYTKLERDMLKTLSRDFEGQGRYQKAYEYLQLYLDIEKEILANDHANKVAELNLKYETELRDKQIKLLHEKARSTELELQSKDDTIALNEARIRERNFILLGVFIVVILLIIISYLFNAQRKLRESKKIAELEHRALRSQMNPHFIFNSLNSIQRMYVEGQTDLANDYMADFSTLMRKILDNSSMELVTLAEELKVLTLYLELENIRCAGKLKFEIELDPQIDPLSIHLPPLILQPFVENAIWHGILPKNASGNIKISAVLKEQSLVLTIDDDGIGFDHADVSKNHESKGILITEQRLGTPVIISSNPEGGTRVTLTISV